MKTVRSNAKPYFFVAVLIAVLSFVLYYGFGVGVVYSEPQVLEIDAFDSPSAKVSGEGGFSSFFSVDNPLVWFMFGSWFALLLFFVLSLLNGHVKR